MALNRIWLAVPVLLLAAVIWWLAAGNPLRDFGGHAPPVEEIAFNAVTLEPGRIIVDVTADGSTDVTIAQVQVDAAYRQFTATPSATIGRLGGARIEIPYPWIEGETHHLALLTSTGVVFDHTIDVAVETSAPLEDHLSSLLLVGFMLGIVPVALGLMFFPAMASLGPKGTRFILALTVGLLIYLLIDMLGEGLESATETLDRLRGPTVVWVSALVAALALLALGRRSGEAPKGAALAGFIALGIGLHNFGEGLAVGAAFATGASALASFLVIGFIVHNVTEGIGIAAPIAKGTRPPLWVFAALALLAGAPAIAGVLAGSTAVSPYLTALAFGLGAGAILQVIIELGAFLTRSEGAKLISPETAGGVLTGLAVMYATALLV